MTHHPDFDWLEQYSAGSLSVGPALCVSVHLSLCAECRRQVDAIQQVGGVLLAELGQAHVDDALLQNVFAAIDEAPAVAPTIVAPTIAANLPHADISSSNNASIPTPIPAPIPAPLRRLIPGGYDQLAWSRVMPTLRIAALDVGDNDFRVTLHRVVAGGKMPTHDHRGSELTLVLTGSFSDEAGLYKAGDFLVREPNQPHQPIATQDQECICLAALAAPVYFTGPLLRWLNPFVR